VPGVCLYFRIGDSISEEKRLTERRKKALAKLASKLKKLLANSKFHSHLASWRVVISTPAQPTKGLKLIDKLMHKTQLLFQIQTII
jgi:hypothetical protein